MVDSYGRWSYDSNEPEKTHCDMDTVADVITKDIGYTPKNITIEDLTAYIYDDFMSSDMTNVYDDNAMLRHDKVLEYVKTVNLEDFDYKH